VCGILVSEIKRF